jgi:prepilin-type N-terminal cleavage/methylation domain-containing protein
MSSIANHSRQRKGRVRKDKHPRGMTLVEMTVALGVACILMVAVVSFLVNGVVSTGKTTAINDTTTRGRYVFEHMSQELARAEDLSSTNFTTPGGSGYAGFNYRVDVGVAPATDQAPLTQNFVLVTFAAPGDLVPPVAGDFLQLPYPYLGPGGTPITDVAATGNLNQYQLTLSDTLANLSGQAPTGQVDQNEVATIQRQRTYMIDTVNGTTLLWYPNNGTGPASYVIASSLPATPPQYPFVPQLKVPGGTSYYVGVQLALAAPPTEAVRVLSGQSSFYTNNTLNAVFANKSGPSFSLVYLPSPTPTPTPSPTATPTPSPTPSPTPTPSPSPTPTATPTPSPTPTPTPPPDD